MRRPLLLALLTAAFATAGAGAWSQEPRPVRAIAINAAASGRAVNAKAGPVQVLFGDGTTIVLGRGAALTIDSYAFDAAADSATLRATLSAGAFRLVGGRASKTGGLALATPFGTLEVDAAAVDVSLGDTPHFDMLFGRTIRLTNGGAILATVRRAGYSIVPGARAEVRMTPAEWRAALQAQLAEAASRRLVLAAAAPGTTSPHLPLPPPGRSIP